MQILLADCGIAQGNAVERRNRSPIHVLFVEDYRQKHVTLASFVKVPIIYRLKAPPKIAISTTRRCSMYVSCPAENRREYQHASYYLKLSFCHFVIISLFFLLPLYGKRGFSKMPVLQFTRGNPGKFSVSRIHNSKNKCQILFRLLQNVINVIKSIM